MSQRERTLAIIKPDAVAAGHAGEIIAMIEAAGFRILGLRMTRLSLLQAEGFYDVHRARDFFADLVAFMTQGAVIVLALERENGIHAWRDLMGNTNPGKAAEGTVRRRFGASIQCNAVHGSDGEDTARNEVAFFFGADDLPG